MRVFDNGCFYTVQCSAADVEAFAYRWPCFGSCRAVAFQFDKRNGDLIDVSRSTAQNDGAGILALAEDAQAYGRKKLGLT